uniref:Uncharacterized protein n=1 Tax=Lotharella oceanica TaxID=641309 RepID=A0A7S2U056_9EUKA
MIQYTMTDQRYHMGYHPFSCEFYIEVVDVEKPEFTKPKPLRACQGKEVGVGEGEQCGGKMITATFNKKTKTNDYPSVSDVSNDCCGPMSCSDFPGSNGMFKWCAPQV